MEITKEQIFSISSDSEFCRLALAIFRWQYAECLVYQQFCDYLGRNPANVRTLTDIPFLPIEFFKTHQVISGKKPIEQEFLSSGTTATGQSHHYVCDISLYNHSFTKGFAEFYGNPAEYTILALLPSYLERNGSSLIYMADWLIQNSESKDSGYYLYDYTALNSKLIELEAANKKVLLIGVTYALLDFAEQHSLKLNNTIVMETGGMKGKRKEVVREEMHEFLMSRLGVSSIHSEYGMTELLSQAYSRGDGHYKAPSWLKVMIRDTHDPLSYVREGISGGINIIDLANIYSCSFISTQDIGKTLPNGHFEVLGRFDNSDIRGCNLMIN